MQRQAVLLGMSALLIGLTAPAQTQDRPADKSARSLEVTLEVRRGDVWRAIDPREVLHSNDEIQFRFRTSYSGYLYVFDISSGGKGSRLYPRDDPRQSNRVEPGEAYVIPGLNGSFLIGGEPGYDTTYWLVSQAPMDYREPSQPQIENRQNTLRPRCRDDFLQARGLCLDERAGPGPVPDLKKAPFALEESRSGLVGRDLKFQAQQGSTRIAIPDSHPGIIIYQFLVAHI